MADRPQITEAQHRRQRLGTVVSTAMQKTVAVRVDRLFRHPRVGRVVKRSRTFLVHDEEGNAKLGDHVLIEETRPRSARKRWQLVEVVKRAPEGITSEAAEGSGEEDRLG